MRCERTNTVCVLRVCPVQYTVRNPLTQNAKLSVAGGASRQLQLEDLEVTGFYYEYSSSKFCRYILFKW